MSSKEEIKCPICFSDSVIYYRDNDLPKVKCTRCGQFSLGSAVNVHFIHEKIEICKRKNISNWIYEHQDIVIQPEDVGFLKNLKPPTIQDRANRLLLHFSTSYPELGAEFKLNDSMLDKLLSKLLHDEASYRYYLEKQDIQEYNHELLTLSWSQNVSEFFFLLVTYLEVQLKYLAITNTDEILITPSGWNYIEKLKTINPKSNIAFVAMSFHPSMKFLFTDAIQPAIIDAGFKDLRIDNYQHNNKIDDEIVAGIRRSKFAVCDFTGQSGNIYFEAGFALGFGLQVIWTCRKDEIDKKKISFDNRQYNFLTWEKDKLDEFKKALQNRIEATVGKPS